MDILGFTTAGDSAASLIFDHEIGVLPIRETIRNIIR